MHSDRGHYIMAAVKQAKYEEDLKTKAERKEMLKRAEAEKCQTEPKASRPKGTSGQLNIRIDPLLVERARTRATCLGITLTAYIVNLIEDDLRGDEEYER